MSTKVEVSSTNEMPYQIVASCPAIFNEIHPALKNDDDFMAKVCKYNPAVFEFASDRIKDKYPAGTLEQRGKAFSSSYFARANMDLKVSSSGRSVN